MITRVHFINDMKQIMRDTIMSALMFAPLAMIMVVKLMVIFLVPFITSATGFDVSPYYHYVLAATLVINAGIMGIVIGFMMIDERDGSITQLMAVTPLGRSGYLINRLSLTAMLALIYCMIGCYVLNLVDLPFFTIMILSVLSAIYAATTGLLIFAGADDKVKGLTVAKGLNVLVLFVFTDLFSLPWLTVTSWFFPPYWMTMIIQSPKSWFGISMALWVHIAWLCILIFHYWRRQS